MNENEIEFKKNYPHIRTLIGKTFGHYASCNNLKIPQPQIIRAGISGGLQINTVCSDVYLGCLPGGQVCYGNCFAARAAFEAGYDYGTRVENILDTGIFMDDLAKLPADQGYVRLGWNSDPSWNWEKSMEISKLIRASGRLPVLVTKCFKGMQENTMREYISIGAELRVSLSAFDSLPQSSQRRKTIEAYRENGGVAVATIISTRFKKEMLNKRQDEIVDYYVSNDFPVAENSLRMSVDSGIMEEIDTDSCFTLKESGDLCCGRLYEDLLIPTITSSPPHYTGLQSAYISKNDSLFLKNLWYDCVPLASDMSVSRSATKPSDCGIPLKWAAVAS